MILISPTKTESNQRIIYGIKKGDKQVIEKVYNEYFFIIANYVKKNSGSLEDAKDIFQEALIVIYHNAAKESFKLDCKFSTYLFSICKNIWLKTLRDRPEKVSDLTHLHELSSDLNTDEAIREAACYNLYLKKFSTLSKKCQDMLKMYFAKIDMKSIAKSLNLSSEAYAKKKKFKCKEQLIKNIKEELLSNKLLQDEYCK
ncbi:MAG: sigma-70 family RNA polymerase sigma factor [Bacteroidota bacterium]